ncbi:MAG: hypothetical protein IT381_21025 [Deltaproteobacteria bacterium]|nr:hypothetical protein [Deltaproteobacteria bacterium]
MANTDPPKSNLKQRNPGVIIAVVVTVVLAFGLFLLRDHFTSSRDKITPKDPQTALPKRDLAAKPMTVPTDPALVTVIVDVNDPAALKQVADTNAWLKQAVESPLGRGFAASWSAFFQSKGEDLQASFRGTVLQFFFDRFFTEPFSLVWFGGDAATGTPAVILDKLSSGAVSALDAMSGIAARGSFTATHCPGQDPPLVQKDKEGKDIPAPVKHTITRWLVAEHAIFVGKSDDRIVLSAKPTAVLQGLCAKVADHKRGKAALELTLVAERFGREAQALAALLGLEGEVRFSVAAAQSTLTPLGVSASLAAPDRLATQAPTDELLKVIPEDTPVAALLQVALPPKLDEASIAAHLKGGSKDKLVPRQVALVWNPRGMSGPTEIALVWSRAEDEAALKTIFNGRNQLVTKKACGQLVLASAQALAERMERSCKGNTPSRLNAAATVVAQAKAAQSVALQVHVGQLLSGLMIDAYRAEQTQKKIGPLPKEIEQAKQQLDALPFFGFRGRVEGKVLVAEGFRS